MARETVTDYLDQIFIGRRYCSECGAMTPAVCIPSKHKPYERFYCELCDCEYGIPPLRPFKISETYGMAIINEGQSIKVVNELQEE
jgi:hypothetical protein